MTRSVGGVLKTAGRTTDSVGSTIDGTTKIIDSVNHPNRLGSAVGGEVRQATGIVDSGTGVVGSTGAVVSSTGRTVSQLGGDRSKPLGAVVGGVADTVTSVGTTVDRLGGSTDELTTSVGNTAGQTVARTIDQAGDLTDHAADTTVTSVTNPIVPLLGSGLVQPAVQIVTGTLPAADPVAQPDAAANETLLHVIPAATTSSAAQRPANVAATADPANTRHALVVPLVLLTGSHTGATGPALHTSAAPARSNRVPMLSAPLLFGIGSGSPVPAPGQLPTPSGAVVTSSSAGGTWQEHAVLPAATRDLIAKLLDLRRSLSATAQTSPYDPGYSPD